MKQLTVNNLENLTEMMRVFLSQAMQIERSK